MGWAESAPARRTARGEIVAHGQATRVQSVRIKLLVPAVIAIAGLVTTGGLLTTAAISDANTAAGAHQIVNLTAATVELDSQVENEMTEIDAQQQRGGTVGIQLLRAQQARTDRARLAYATLAQDVGQAVPQLRPLFDRVDGLLSQLSVARISVAGNVSEAAEGRGTYADLDVALLGLLETLPTALSDPDLSDRARSLASLAAATRLAAAQRDLLRAVLVRHQFQAGEQVALAGLRGGEQQRIEEFQRTASPDDLVRWRAIQKSPDVRDAGVIKSGVLDDAPGALAGDADVWYVAQTAVIRLMRDVAADVSDGLLSVADTYERDAITRAVVVGICVFLFAAGTLALAIAVAARTSFRLRRLRRSALAVAYDELPTVISQVATAPDATAVNRLIQGRSALEDTEFGGPDEVGQVAATLHAVHRAALRLAADQAILRLDVSALFVALSRRGQSLVNRQLQLIDDFEAVETNPETLSRVFAIDHLAARMRRNEENLLVLAGGEPTRQFTSPEPLHDIIRAAGAEIEAYGRVDIAAIAEVNVVSFVVGDLVHLLAELLENATSYSAPTTRVRVSARQALEGVGITIFDEGIGMTPAQVDEANARLAEPEALTSALAGTMGLLVVARLAARRGIKVHLRSTLSSGTIAFVDLPNAILSAPSLHQQSVSVGAVPAANWRPTRRQLDRRRDARAYPSLAISPSEMDVTVTAEMKSVLARLAETETDGASSTGDLPHRTPGDLLVPDPEHAYANPAAEKGTVAPLDPEVVRARLSSLAGGIAAARRQT
jgi:hypothetical protein